MKRLLFLILALVLVALPAVAVDMEAVEQLNTILEKLRAEIKGPVETPIPAVATPQEVMDLVEHAEKVTSGDPELARSQLLQEIYIEAFLQLYKGRGKSPEGDGWYAARNIGDTGIDELSILIGNGVFDEKGKEFIKSQVESFNFNDNATKRRRGFPPNKTIMTERERNGVLKALAKSKTAPEYKPLENADTGDVSLRTLIDRIPNISREERAALYDFVGAMDDNLYDRSLKKVKEGSNEEYYGRHEELAQMVDAISRIEKGHFLMTGKAGVGKTTLMRMLSDALVSGAIKIRNELPPIVLELSILDVTNKQDPTAIKIRLATAQRLSELLNRRIILYVDEGHVSSEMVRNAVKSFLARKLLKEENQVHLIFSTTSSEARDFLKDSAFSRRFVDIYIREFTDAETTALIKKAYVPLWKAHHFRGDIKFDGITDEAFEYANKYAWFEQPHAGFPTGPKELLEGTIVRQLRVRGEQKQKGPFVIGVAEIRDYIKSVLQKDLIPGDPDFDQIFDKKWADFEKEYQGNDGLKIEMKKFLKNHFATLKREKMDAAVVLGPPGAGKSYLAEKLAEYFFKGAILTINGSDLKNGGLELNKLIGSPPGTVGSEEQRSMLSKFMSENPRGGIILIEEGDYMHQDAVQVFTNMITKLQFTDGLGKEWNTSQYILINNSNIGQDLMIPPDAKNKMSWDQYETRRRQLTDKVTIDGKEVEMVRKDKLEAIFDQYVHTIVTTSHPDADTSIVAQEANKQRRRYKAFYVLPPTRDELRTTTEYKIRKFQKKALSEYQVNFEFNNIDLDRIIDIDRFQFEKGYSYIDERLEERLFQYLTSHLHRRDEVVKVTMHLEPGANDEDLPKLQLKVATKDGEQTHELELRVRTSPNPWFDDVNMRQRIRTFESRMRQTLRGNNQQISETKALLRLKMQDWSTRVVITQLGTSGNGKTEFFKAMARTLYEDEGALFKISGLNHKYQLGNYFRPPTGVQGGKEETEFERWFKARLNAGGGIILFDELLSFAGMTQHEIAYKIEVINELYDLLDEGLVRFGNKAMDGRGFIIGITGNALAEFFQGVPDDPSAERLVKRLLEDIDNNKIIKYMGEKGIDPPKVARFGLIFVNGPLPQSETLEIGKIKIAALLKEVERTLGRDVKLEIDSSIIDDVVKNLTTVKLGMRAVDAGFKKLLKEPIAGILNDFPDVRSISVFKDEKDGHIRWKVNGKEVILEGVAFDGSGLEEKNWVYLKEKTDGAENRTPQIKDLVVPEKNHFTPESRRIIKIHEVYGHFLAAVMLQGKNPSETISVIPGDGYGGYVRPITEDHRTMDTLSTLLIEAVELEAGHRAVFRIAGIYAVGGGDGVLTPHGKGKPRMRTDDIGKVSRVIDSIFANQLLADISELSSEKDIAMGRKLLKRIVVHMADSIIEKGYKSKQFEPVFNLIDQKDFLDREHLDPMVAQMDPAIAKQPQLNIMEAFHEAVERLTANVAPEKLAKTPGMALLKELSERLTAELSAASVDVAHKARIKELGKKVEEKIPATNCATALAL